MKAFECDLKWNKNIKTFSTIEKLSESTKLCYVVYKNDSYFKFEHDLVYLQHIRATEEGQVYLITEGTLPFDPSHCPKRKCALRRRGGYVLKSVSNQRTLLCAFSEVNCSQVNPYRPSYEQCRRRYNACELLRDYVESDREASNFAKRLIRPLKPLFSDPSLIVPSDKDSLSFEERKNE